MGKPQFYTILLTTVFLFGVAADDQCPYLDCDCFRTYIDCEGRELKTLSINHPKHEKVYKRLILDTNQITKIPANSLPKGVSEISLMDNPIRDIDTAAFDKMVATLTSLTFTNARFSRIPDAFVHLQTLKRLIIVNTPIRDWNIAAMAHIGQTLETLKLENVGLTRWPHWISYFSRLYDLSLTGSTMTYIPDNAFDHIDNRLMTLTLAGNKLNSTSKSFTNLTNLIILDLQSNHISYLTWLPHSFRLMDLPISNNNIKSASHLSGALRVYSASLVSATMSFNKLTQIPDLFHLIIMREVDLSHNKISYPKSGSIPYGVSEIDFSFNLLPSVPSCLMKLRLVTSLDLSHNLIRDIYAHEIPSWATIADFSYNLITELRNTSFPLNSSISELNLSFNALYTISDEALLNLYSLDTLNLEGTRISRLPLSLARLSKLDYLDVSNCAHLACTCQDKALVARMTSRMEVRVNTEHCVEGRQTVGYTWNNRDCCVKSYFVCEKK